MMSILGFIRSKNESESSRNAWLLISRTQKEVKRSIEKSLVNEQNR